MATKSIRFATPGQIGTMERINRVVMPAVGNNNTYQGHFTAAAVTILRRFVDARVRSNQERD